MEPKLSYFITIRDFQGNIIPDRPTSLHYKMSEDEDELCEIEIESADRYVADKAVYREGKQLTVVWGWINGTVSNTRTVYIFDRDTEYHQDAKVQLKLICHERFAVGKMDAPANKNLTQLKDNAPIVFSSNVIKNVKLQIEKGNPELKALIQKNNFNIGLTATPYGKNAQVVSTYNGSMSTYYTLRNLLDRLPGGPYVMDSRDDVLLIRTRDFKAASKKTFTWAGGTGELKRFKPCTKNRSTKASAAQVTVSTYDPKTKTATNVQAKSGTTKDVKLANGNTLDIYIDDINDLGPKRTQYYPDGRPKVKGPVYIPRSTDKLFTAADIHGALQRDKAERAERDKNAILNINGGKPNIILQTIKKNRDAGIKGFNRENPYNDFSNKEVDKGLIVERRIKTGNPNITLNKLYLGADDGKTFQGGNSRDNTAIPHNNFGLIGDQKTINKAAMSNDNAEKAAAHAENMQKDAELESNPATAELIGQPEIEIGQIVTILGVSKLHSGNYYISECEHVLKDTEYDLNLTKLLRHGVNDIGTTHYKKTKKKGKKVDLYSLIPNNPNLPPRTPVQVINDSKGPEANSPIGRKKLTNKTPGKS